MNEESGFIARALRDLLASTVVILAAWGALGGATNALTTKMRLRDAIRHILLGGMIAAGMGSLSLAIVARWLDLPAETVAAGGAAGSAAYLVGVFGPAFIEVTLARLRGRDRNNDADNPDDGETSRTRNDGAAGDDHDGSRGNDRKDGDGHA